MGRTGLGLVVLLLLPALLTGCLGEDGTPGEDGDEANAADWTFEDFIVTDHDHEDPAAHTYSSPTMHEIAHHQLGNETAYSYLGEIDSNDGLTAVAVVGQGSTPGFVLVDTSDPSQPQVLGRAQAPYAYAVDVKLTPDNQYVLMASQSGATGQVGGVPTPEGLQDGTYQARHGILVWDISDPMNPEMVTYTPVEPNGCHMLALHEAEGQPYVFCINTALTTLRFETGPQVQLVPVNTYWPFGQEGSDTLVDKQNPLGASPHDMTFQLDPIDQTPVLTVSHWDLGVAVLDVSNPLAPTELSRWAGQGAEHYDGYLHSAMLTAIDGTRYLVATPETLSDIVPAVWVLQVDDWASPELVAEWTNPGGHTSHGIIMTTHQFQLLDGKMYMTYNHNGIWVLDLATMIETGGSSEDNAEILGVHLPQPGDVTFYDRESYPMGIPAPWDINVVDGYILTADRYTGLHVLHYAEDEHTPEMTSFA